MYRSAMLDSLPWPLRSGESYDASCRTCEIEISIATAGDRTALVDGLVWDVERGRVVSKPIARFPRLQLHDRLHPSVYLVDVGAVESMGLPRVLTFWRPTWHGDSCVDPMRFRCPLFWTQLSTSPPVLSRHRFATHVVLWPNDAMGSNGLLAWRVRGPTSMGRIDICCKRLTADLLFWSDQENIPHDRRVRDITAKMLGGGVDSSFFEEGCLLKFKAAEVSMLLPFCLYLLQRYGPALEHADSLIEAGLKLAEVKREIKTPGTVFELDALQRVFDQMQRHLILCDVVGIHFSPKHHLCLRLVVRIVPS